MRTFVDLGALFEDLNRAHFDGFLELPALSFNTRLRASAGRFTPGRRRSFVYGTPAVPPLIEIAAYLMDEPRARELVADTLGHEMIHYWLWVRRRPYGHTEEFWAKMEQMGVSRYNTVPAVRAHKYVYACPACAKEFRAKRRLGRLACADCCGKEADGRFDARYVLRLMRELTPAERRAERDRLVREKAAAEPAGEPR
jgi:predicted SprT family Zn-dependent metalloprotease